MSRQFPSVWLPRLLFWLCLAAALGLILLVFLAPSLDNEAWGKRTRVVAVFARDTALRRTTLASGVALVITAYVFFRPPGGARRAGPKRRGKWPPSDMAGA